MLELKKRQVVQVTWTDSQDHADKWVDSADAEAFSDVDCTIVSVGLVVRKTDKYLTLAGDYDAVDDDYGRVTKIPAGMIQEVKELV